MVAQLIVHPWPLVDGSSHHGERAANSSVRAALSVPDDEEVLLARVAVASLCMGSTRFSLGFVSASLRALLGALEHYGVEHSWDGAHAELQVVGRGLDGFTAPDQALDLRGEAAVAALVVGLCVSRPFVSEVWVGAGVAEVLVALLAENHTLEAEDVPDGGKALRLLPRAHERPALGVAARDYGVFPWAKQAVLLAGLRASSATTFEERFASADHLERALLQVRAPLDGHGTYLVLHPPRDPKSLRAQDYEHVGSIDAGLAVICAALAARAGELGVREVCVNPTRTHAVALLRGLGLDVRVIAEGDRQGEPVGRVIVGWKRAIGTDSGAVDVLRAGTVQGETAFALGDAQLHLAALASSLGQPWRFSDHVSKVRDNDGKIWSRTVGLLRSVGASAENLGEDGWRIQGRTAPLDPLTVTSGGDARLVLAATLLGLRARGPSVIDDVECLRGAYPKWVGTLRALGARVEVRDAEV